MTKMNLACLILCTILLSNISVAQHYSSGIVVTTKGYILNVGENIIFQPCEENNKGIFNRLDYRSFVLGSIPNNDGILDAISDIGDTMLVSINSNLSWGKYNFMVKYFYCELTVNLLLFDTVSKPKFINPLGYELFFGDKKYSCLGYSIKNRVIKVVPSKKKDLDSIYDYYKHNDYVVPEWLDDIYNPNKEVYPQLNYDSLKKMGNKKEKNE